MRLKGYYYFLDDSDIDSFGNLLSLLLKENLALGLFFILTEEVRCRDDRVFGNNSNIYGFTIMFDDESLINMFLTKKILRTKSLVDPSSINNTEWDEEDRLKNARYFEDFKEFMNCIQSE